MAKIDHVEESDFLSIALKHLEASNFFAKNVIYHLEMSRILTPLIYVSTEIRSEELKMPSRKPKASFYMAYIKLDITIN
jgi:hypothetical protein